MEIKRICQSQWNDVKNIYMEAFPKAERKPFFFLKRAVRKGKSEIWVASESDVVAGFIVLIPYHDMILVEYLAVSNQIRSKGTGSKILGEICRQYDDCLLYTSAEDDGRRARAMGGRCADRGIYRAPPSIYGIYSVYGCAGHYRIVPLSVSYTHLKRRSK